MESHEQTQQWETQRERDTEELNSQREQIASIKKETEVYK
jgi:hypothetical protein